MHRLACPAFALAAAMVAGAACAQPLDLRPPERAQAPAAPLALPGQPARALPDRADPLDPLAPTRIVANPMSSAVFARTAVERSFARRDEVKGSLGFLCGLQPSHAEAGGAGAYGVDPHGRFVGAKLSFAFR